MKQFLFLLLIVIILFVNIVKCDSNNVCVIQFNEDIESIEGIESVSPNGVRICSYLGIPYAQPPIADLRFEPPVKASNWTSIKKFDTESKSCYALFFINDTAALENTDEDCLYLNVHTKQMQTNDSLLRPVFFWIHGGSFNFGSATSDVNGTDYIVEKDVIVVTINYRLSVLGFLSIPEANISGNFGLKDQQMALKWVQENIIYFGGDPNRVTLVGWSAGSASVTYHMYSESSSGLFHNAIAMSGTMLNTWAYIPESNECALGLFNNLEQNLELNSINLKQLLQEISPEELMVVRSLPVMPSIMFFGFPYPCFIPTIETNSFYDRIIINSPQNLFKNTPINNVPLLIGYTNLEIEPLPMDLRFEFSDMIFKNTNETVIFENLKILIEDKLKSNEQIFLRKLRSMGDLIYGAKKFIRYSGITKVYMYRFSYDGVFGNMKSNYIFENYTYSVGAVHGDDLGYLFMPFCCNSTVEMDMIQNETFISNIVLNMWTNFVKYSNPTPSDQQTDEFNLIWPNYNDNNEFIDINLESKILQDKNDLIYDLWDYIEKCLQEDNCDYFNEITEEKLREHFN